MWTQRNIDVQIATDTSSWSVGGFFIAWVKLIYPVFYLARFISLAAATSVGYCRSFVVKIPPCFKLRPELILLNPFEYGLFSPA